MQITVRFCLALQITIPIVGRGVAKIAKIRRDYVIAKGYAFNALPPRAILDVRLPQGDGVQPLAQKVEVCGF